MQLAWLEKMHALGSDSYHGKVKEIMDRNSSVVEGETILGTLPDDLQKLVVASSALKLRAVELITEHTQKHLKGEHPEEECAAFHRKVRDLDHQASILLALMWQEVEDLFPKSDPSLNLGVRTGFQVVEFREKEQDPGSNARTMIITLG